MLSIERRRRSVTPIAYRRTHITTTIDVLGPRGGIGGSRKAAATLIIGNNYITIVCSIHAMADTILNILQA